MIKERYTWVKDASCGGLPVDLFFGPGSAKPAVLDICADCPVRQLCLDTAMREERGESARFGIRGGLSAKRRKELAEAVGGHGAR